MIPKILQKDLRSKQLQKKKNKKNKGYLLLKKKKKSVSLQEEERLHVCIHTWQLPGNNTFKTGMQVGTTQALKILRGEKPPPKKKIKKPSVGTNRAAYLLHASLHGSLIH